MGILKLRLGDVGAAVMLLGLLLLIGCSSERALAPAPDFGEPGSRLVIGSRDYAAGTVEVVDGFGGAFGLAVANDGGLYVPDIWRGQVVRFTPELRPEGWLGMVDGPGGEISGWHLSSATSVRGKEYGAFDMAHSVDFDRDGNIFVADYGTGRVHRYAPDGAFLGVFWDDPPTPELAFDGTANAYFDADFNLWVTDYDLHRVMKFDPEGELIGWMGERSTGEATLGFTTKGSAQQSAKLCGFYKPQMTKVDAQGNIYVVEIGNNRIQKFTSDGLLIGWLGAREDGSLTDGWATEGLSAKSKDPGGFDAPVSIFFMEGDTILIAEAFNHRIQKFTTDGQFVAWLGGTEEGASSNGWLTKGLSVAGTEIGMFDNPYDAVIHDGKMYVADGHNGRIQIFSLEGELLSDHTVSGWQ